MLTICGLEKGAIINANQINLLLCVREDHNRDLVLDNIAVIGSKSVVQGLFGDHCSGIIKI